MKQAVDESLHSTRKPSLFLIWFQMGEKWRFWPKDPISDGIRWTGYHLKERGSGPRGSCLFAALSRRGTEAAGAEVLSGQPPPAAGRSADKVRACPHIRAHPVPEGGDGVWREGWEWVGMGGCVCGCGCGVTCCVICTVSDHPWTRRARCKRVFCMLCKHPLFHHRGREVDENEQRKHE